MRAAHAAIEGVAGLRPLSGVERVLVAIGAVNSRGLDFSSVYGEWFDPVLRWLRALGAPELELEDLAQEVFLVVRRKLGDFDGRNLPGWLYRIAANTWSDHRRRGWWKNLWRGRREVVLEDLPEPGRDAGELLEDAEARSELHRLLGKMSEKRRSAFVLFEIEGYDGEEIAKLLGIPVATVWTRLHHARKDFLTLVESRRREEER